MFRPAAFALIVTAGFIPTLKAQDAIGPLVSVSWLVENSDSPDLILLHVGQEGSYNEAHIPGAKFVSHDALAAPREPGRILEMPNRERMQAALESFGVTDRSRVVVVFTDEWVTPATRLLVTLQFAGLEERAAILDGGQAGWVAAGGPVTKEISKAAHGDFTPRLVNSMITDAVGVQAAHAGSSIQIVDARAPVYYDGPAHSDHPAGHIPGAANIPYSTLVADDLTLLPKAELRKLFDAAGIEPGQPMIVYCHIGQQATLLFTAARILGHPVQLYDGSFDDWATRKLPLEGGEKD